MKGGVLSSWIKEFASLVLIQTIQAFLFTIVIVLIVNTSQASADDNTKNSALGLIGIVGLASISKIEDLVKKMLGVSSSVTDTSMKAGLASVATGMAIAGAVKNRVMTNGKKFIGGIQDARSATKGIKKENKRYDTKLRLSGVGLPGEEGVAGGIGGTSEASSLPPARSDALFNDEEMPTATNGQLAGANGNAGRLSNDQRRTLMKLQEMKEAHEDKIKDLEKKRRDARKNAISAPIEAGLSFTGTVGGAALGASTGEIDDILKAAGTGAIIGDFIGEKAVSGVAAVQGKASDISKSMATTKKELQSYIDKQIERGNRSSDSELKSQYRKYKKDLKKKQDRDMDSRKKAADDLIEKMKNNIDLTNS